MFDVCAGVGLEGGLEGGLGGDGVVRDVEDDVRSQSFEGPGRRLRVLAPMDTCGGFVQYFTYTRSCSFVHVTGYTPSICYVASRLISFLSGKSGFVFFGYMVHSRHHRDHSKSPSSVDKRKLSKVWWMRR